MRQATLCTVGAIAFTFLIACCAYSQTLNIWPGIAPGSENWTQKERSRREISWAVPKHCSFA